MSTAIPIKRPHVGFRSRVYIALFGLLLIAIAGVALGFYGRIERNQRLQKFSEMWTLSEETDLLIQQINDLHRQFTLVSQAAPGPGVPDALPEVVRARLEQNLADAQRRIQRIRNSGAPDVIAVADNTAMVIDDWRYVLARMHEDFVAAVARLVNDASPRAERLLEQDLPVLHDALAQKLLADQQAVDDLGDKSDRILVLALVIPLILFAWISYLVVRRVLRSLNTINEGIQIYAGGDFSHRVAIDGDDEFVDAAAQINRMAEQSQRDREALSQLNATLEAKVQERTAELSASSKRLAEAQRIARLGSWQLDLVKNHLRWSDEVFHIFEIDPATFGGHYESFLEAVHPDDRDAVNQAYTHSLKARKPYQIIHRLKMADDRIKHVEERCETEFDAQGTPLVSRGTIQDITEKVRAEEALHEKDIINRQVINTALDAVVIIDDAGKVVDWNSQAETMFGWTRTDVLGQTIEQTIIPHKYRDAHRAGMKHYLATGEGPALNQRLELTALRKSGAEFPIELAISPMRIGERQAFSAFIRDLTTVKEDARERERLREQLAQSQKMEAIGRLAGGVAHDFNNMLSVIIGYTDLASSRVPDTADASRHLKEIRNAADRASGVTRQLLAFARKQTVVPKLLDLNETVKGMLGMLRRLLGEHIELVWSPDDQPQHVLVDPSQIDQILVNLCVNAREAIEGSGRITIETGHSLFTADDAEGRDDIKPGDYAKIMVSDNGCGMDKETMAMVFEPFFTTKGKGTGLGLATVYGIARQNKGFVNVYSEIDIGTTFTVYLPRAADSSGPHNERKPALATMAAQEQHTILVVEDEPAILSMIKEMLGSLGYLVLAAGVPSEAIDMAEKHNQHIHLLLSDVIMPEMNGREMAKKLSARRPNMKVLFMSGYTSDFIDKHGVLEQGVHFIQKPFSPMDLAGKIQSIL